MGAVQAKNMVFIGGRGRDLMLKNDEDTVHRQSGLRPIDE